MSLDNVQPYSESALIVRLKEGERAAYGELYDRYSKSLYAIIFELVKSESDAEHLLQDTFVKIWHHIEKYDVTKGRLYTWLVVIARRLALDFLRSKYFLEKQAIQGLETAVSVEKSAPEIQHLDYIGLDQVVRNLEPNLKQIIDLQYFKGYSQQEVAEQLGLPLGTVKSRTRAALLRLRQQLSFEQ